jgi:hypothetical protein
MTTLNKRTDAVPFNPTVHVKGTLEVNGKGGRKHTVHGIVRDLGKVQLRRRLDNPHNCEWTVAI